LELAAIFESIDVCDSKILKCSDKINNLNNESSDLLSNGKVVRESINKIDLESRVLNESNNKLELKKDVLTNKIKDYLSKLDQLLARKDELEKTLKSSENDRVACKNELDVVTSNIVRLNFVSQAFSPSGMRAVILESIAINFMNERLEHYSKMVGFSCYLTNKVFTKAGDKRNKIDVVLDEKKTYKGCSRGEKRRIDLCIQCAINDLAIALGGSNINLLVADEIIDPLDDGGVNGFVGILKEKYQKQSNATMLLVSHKPFFSELLDSKWLFSSNGGSTSIEIANV
jgi:DNA repair exonuclease SbcCD ATPase subunit